MHRRRIKRWTLLVLLLVALGVVGHVEAADGMRGDRCEVAVQDHITEDFYFVCRVLIVRGVIDGDLIGIANEVQIERSALIAGDLWIGGGKVFVSGTVGDDIHFFGVNLTIRDRARFPNERIDVTSAALNTEISSGAALPGDLLVYGYQVQINGIVGGDVDFQGEALTINGAVNGRIDATVGDLRRSSDVPGLPIYDVSFKNPGLRVSEEAYIGGDLSYYSASRSHIPPGVVGGRILYHQVLSQPDITQAEQADAAAEILKSYLWASLRDLFTLLLIGIIALYFAPNFVRQPAFQVRRRVITTVGWGLVTFMLSFPIAIILIILSLVVFLVLVWAKLSALSVITGVALLVLNVSLIGGFGFLLLFMGRVIISFVIGYLIYRYVLRSPEPGTFGKWLTELAVGAVVYALITNVPLPPLGLTLELITGLSGIGAIAMYLRQALNTTNLLGQRTPAAPVKEPAAPRKTPPSPPAEDLSMMPGMENLPEGFTGFDEDW